MVASELGVGSLKRWVSLSLGLLDTVALLSLAFAQWIHIGSRSCRSSAWDFKDHG